MIILCLIYHSRSWIAFAEYFVVVLFSSVYVLQAYSPLGSPGTTWMNGNVLKEPVIISISEKLGKTPAQVALRWNIQMGRSVLPKSTNQERIKQNLDVHDWSIPDDVLAKFSEIKEVFIIYAPSNLSNTLMRIKQLYLLMIVKHLHRITWCFEMLPCYAFPKSI